MPGSTLDVPHGSLKGHILTTEPATHHASAAASRPIATPIDGNRLLAGGTVDEGDDTPDLHPEIVAGIMADLEQSVPGPQGHRVSHAWTCFRPTHPDSLPVIDRVPGIWERLGDLRALPPRHPARPATGRALARWVSSGEQPSEVVGLEIGRFAGTRVEVGRHRRARAAVGAGPLATQCAMASRARALGAGRHERLEQAAARRVGRDQVLRVELDGQQPRMLGALDAPR